MADLFRRDVDRNQFRSTSPEFLRMPFRLAGWGPTFGSLCLFFGFVDFDVDLGFGQLRPEFMNGRAEGLGTYALGAFALGLGGLGLGGLGNNTSHFRFQLIEWNSQVVRHVKGGDKLAAILKSGGSIGERHVHRKQALKPR